MGNLKKAIEFLSEHHRKHPDNPDFQHVILDALYALGKTENDFDWVEKPPILRMLSDILEACYEFLKSKQKPRSVSEIHGRFLLKGYLLFTEEDLLKALSADGRFIVEDASADLFAEVRVRQVEHTRKISWLYSPPVKQASRVLDCSRILLKTRSRKGKWRITASSRRDSRLPRRCASASVAA